MAQSYFCKLKGSIHGPLSGRQLRDLAIAGKLLPDSLIRLDGTDQWIAAGKFKNLEFSQPERAVVLQPVSSLPPSPNPPQPICTHCGKELGLFRGLEGRKIICQHCNKITVVISRAEALAPVPRVAPRFQDAELAELVDEDVGNFGNGRSSPTVERHRAHRSLKAEGEPLINPNLPTWSKALLYMMLFCGVWLMIGGGITLWVIFGFKPDPEQRRETRTRVIQALTPTPVFNTTEEQISGGGQRVNNDPIPAVSKVSFSSLTQMLDGLPENNRPKGGSDGAIEMRSANGWLKKKVVGNTLVFSLKVSGVLLQDFDGKYSAAIYFDEETIPGLRNLPWGGEGKIGKDFYRARVLFQQDVVEYKPYINSGIRLNEDQARKVRELKGKNITLRVLIEDASFSQCFDGKHQFEVWMRSKEVTIEGMEDLLGWNASPT